MTSKPLNFKTIEALRKQMLLTVKDMAKILGASRQTYYSWVSGIEPRPSRTAKLRVTIRKMVNVLRDEGWPSTEVLEMEPADRVKYLSDLMEAQE